MSSNSTTCNLLKEFLQNLIKASLQFLFYFVMIKFLMIPMDKPFFRSLYITTAGVKFRVAAVKNFPVLHISVVTIFWSFKIIDSSTV
jgi:hypothetical protein